MDRDQERQLCGLRTPCYVLDEDQYLENIREFRFHFEQRWGGRCLFGYSVKTNHLRWPILLAREEGFLAEVVSPDEYEMVRGLGFADTEIIYNGPQKRDTVLTAMQQGALVNLDSLSECETVAAAARKGELEGASVGLRVNFDLEARCPGETTCGSLVSRFGICVPSGVKRIESSSTELPASPAKQNFRCRTLSNVARVCVTPHTLPKRYVCERSSVTGCHAPSAGIVQLVLPVAFTSGAYHVVSDVYSRTFLSVTSFAPVLRTQKKIAPYRL